MDAPSRPASPFYVSPDDAPAKRELLQAALRLFVRGGLSGTSVRAIAEQAGYSNPALFKHFESKEALALYLFERCYRRHAGAITASFVPGASFATNRRAVLRRFLELYDEDADAFLYLHDNLRQFWPKVDRATRRLSLIALVRRLVLDGVACGEVRTDVDADLLVAGFTGTLSQFARLHYFGELKGPAAGRFDALDRMLAGMLRP